MKKISDFIGPVKTPAMKVRVIGPDGTIIKRFEVPEGFQLERYVDSLYPENEFMVNENGTDISISVMGPTDIVEIYIGIYT